MSSRDSKEMSRPSKNRFEAVFQLIPQATAIVRASDGVHLMVNDAFVRMMGFTRDEVIGRTADDLGIVSRDQHAMYVGSLRRTERGNLLATIRTRSGKDLRLALASAQIDFGGERCLLNVGADVTEQETSEAELRDADRRKDIALALLVHELRNPLMPILHTAEILRQREDQASRDAGDVILRQAQYIERLVEDVLDVAGVTTGKIKLAKKRLELADIVARAVEATGPLLETRRHRLELSVPAVGLAIEADEVRLTQVVNNLLANAARYTPLGGNVSVSAAREGDEVVLRVRDTGIGIDAALMPDIFKMFVQGPPPGAPAGESARAGLGLGLSLVQMLTEMHGGRVAARSDGPGRGSEFAVRLPAAR